MDLNLLAIFSAVARTLSFSEAARQLGLPKSSVSRAIASLESTVKAQLLQRTTRQVVLTQAGAALHERLAPRLQSLNEAVGETVDLETSPSGTLRISATADLATAVLVDVVTQFRRRYPAVNVELHLTVRPVDLVAEGFDLALRIAVRRMPPASAVVRRLGTVRAGIFASPEYLARRGAPRSPEELTQHDWVTLPQGPPLVLVGPRGPVRVEVPSRIVADEMAFIRQVARVGGAMAMLPTFLADEDVRTGRLVRLLPRWAFESGTLLLVLPSRKHVPRRAELFRDCVVDAFRARSLFAP